MAPGDPERPERPAYNVYRGGSAGRGRGRRAEQPQADAEASAVPEGSGGDDGGDSKSGAGYTVYKARRRFSRPSGDGGGSLRDRFRRGDSGEKRPLDPGDRPLWRRVLKWVAVGVGAWLLLSLVLFVVSAQIQSSKLNDATADQLSGFPLLVASGQTILVMGTDSRPEGSDEAGAETDPKCLEASAQGDPPPSSCLPSRADTLMLVRAGGGAFEKLSIPRDTFAAIPGQENQKINGAYAFGGAELQVETIENFLGIDINHVVILDFDGFADFIDSLGGVQVALREPVKSKISGGAANGGVSLNLERGKVDLNGQEALALARTRENLKCDGKDEPESCDDVPPGDPERAALQQLVLAGIQDRLTSPTRIPYNFLHAPWIAWNAPKAMVSDMGGLTLPQLAIAAGIGGNSPTQILIPSGTTDGGALVVDSDECRKAVAKFLGGPGPRQPACSPAG